MVAETYQKLRSHDDLYRIVVENLRDHAIFTVDRHGRIATWNEGAERVLGFSESEIVGQPASIVFTPEDREASVPDWEMRTALHEGVAGDERWHLRKGGERFWGHGLMHVLQNDEIIGFVKIVRDETPRKQAEDQLIELNQTLEARVEDRTHRVRKLARELDQTEQRERRRLAERLHDHLQQLLIGVRLKLSALVGRLKQSGDRQAVEEADELLDEAVQESRAITRELSPPSIPEGGLKAAFEQLAECMEQTHGLKVHLAIHADTEPASEDLRFFLHRAARELLMNTVKHAAAENVKTEEAHLMLERLEEHIRLTVEDRGPGFNPSAITESSAESGYGLRSLREKCELLGGKFEIDSAPGRGTRTTLTLPLNSR